MSVEVVLSPEAAVKLISLVKAEEPAAILPEAVLLLIPVGKLPKSSN